MIVFIVVLLWFCGTSAAEQFTAAIKAVPGFANGISPVAVAQDDFGGFAVGSKETVVQAVYNYKKASFELHERNLNGAGLLIPPTPPFEFSKAILAASYIPSMDSGAMWFSSYAQSKGGGMNTFLSGWVFEPQRSGDNVLMVGGQLLITVNGKNLGTLMGFWGLDFLQDNDPRFLGSRRMVVGIYFVPPGQTAVSQGVLEIAPGTGAPLNMLYSLNGSSRKMDVAVTGRYVWVVNHSDNNIIRVARDGAIKTVAVNTLNVEVSAFQYLEVGKTDAVEKSGAIFKFTDADGLLHLGQLMDDTDVPTDVLTNLIEGYAVKSIRELKAFPVSNGNAVMFLLDLGAGTEALVLVSNGKGSILKRDDVALGAAPAGKITRLIASGPNLFFFQKDGLVERPYQAIPVAVLPPPPVVPIINAVTNAASNAEQPIAPGTIMTIYGLNLGFPEQRVGEQVGGASVSICGKASTLLINTGTQINAVAPTTLAGDPASNCSVVVTVGDQQGSRPIKLAPQAISLFTFTALAPPPMNKDDTQEPDFVLPIATHGDGTLIGPSGYNNGQVSPALPGETIVLYGTGCGRAKPQVTIGDSVANLVYSGISPEFLGLCQMNVVVPLGTTSGQAGLGFGDMPDQVYQLFVGPW